jgi:hypothetical protein
LSEDTGGAPVAQESTRLPDDTPLGPHLKRLAGSSAQFEEARAAAVEAHDLRQSMISACMAKSGFDYYPIPYGGPLTPEEPWLERGRDLPVPPLDDARKVVAKWGYGIEPEYSDGVDQTANRDPEHFDIAERNRVYQETLNPEGAKEYWMVLRGWDSPDTGGADPGREAGSCVGEAFAAVPQTVENSGVVNSLFDGLRQPIVNVVKWDLGVDPEAVALDAEWANCMGGKGITFAPAQFERPDGRVSDVSLLNRPGPHAAFSLAGQMGPAGPEASGEQPGLHAYPRQVEIALADIDCRAEVDYANRITDIQLRLERRFVDDHRDELAALEQAAAG